MYSSNSWTKRLRVLSTRASASWTFFNISFRVPCPRRLLPLPCIIDSLIVQGRIYLCILRFLHQVHTLLSSSGHYVSLLFMNHSFQMIHFFRDLCPPGIAAFGPPHILWRVDTPPLFSWLAPRFTLPSAMFIGHSILYNRISSFDCGHGSPPFHRYVRGQRHLCMLFEWKTSKPVSKSDQIHTSSWSFPPSPVDQPVQQKYSLGPRPFNSWSKFQSWSLNLPITTIIDPTKETRGVNLPL